jgi:hypothetical protein
VNLQVVTVLRENSGWQYSIHLTMAPSLGTSAVLVNTNGLPFHMKRQGSCVEILYLASIFFKNNEWTSKYRCLCIYGGKLDQYISLFYVHVRQLKNSSLN